MKFGPAEMAQMMDAAKALLSVTMVSSVGIGLVLGVIVALFAAFFRRGLHRDLTREHISIGNDTINVTPDDCVTRSGEQRFPITLSVLLFILAVGSGVFYWHYTSQGSDTPQRPDLPLRSAYTEVYSTLGISPLPEAVEAGTSIRRPLEQLNRERCDRRAIFDLETALENAGYRREAAKVFVAFSTMCGGDAPSLRQAANVLEIELKSLGVSVPHILALRYHTMDGKTHIMEGDKDMHVMAMMAAFDRARQRREESVSDDRGDRPPRSPGSQRSV